MFDFKVTPDDGEPFFVTATSRDVSRWERTNRGASVSQLVGDSMQVSGLEQVAWIASVRLGKFDGSIADFRNSCDIDFQEDDDADPTRPTP